MIQHQNTQFSPTGSLLLNYGSFKLSAHQFSNMILHIRIMILGKPLYINIYTFVDVRCRKVFELFKLQTVTLA